MKDRELVDRLVTLLDPLETRGGTVFPAGMTMRISKMWRGRANLIAVTPRPDGTYQAIRGVGRSSFELAVGAPSAIKAIPAPPKPKKKPGRRELLRVIGKLQDLVSQAHHGYMDDRAVDRAKKVCEPLEEAFALCVKAREMDPP